MKKFSILNSCVATAALSLVAHSSFASEETADSSSAEIVEQIIVRGARTSTATKMNAPVLEVPQNIQVLSAKFIDDIGAVHLEDALRHVAGVSVGNWYEGYDFLRIRGFNGVSYLDGMRIDSVNLSGEVFGLERIEVLKGPSSVLYGGGLLSGMVNLVSKRPKAGRFVDAQFTGGEHDYMEASLDVGSRAGTVQGCVPGQMEPCVHVDAELLCYFRRARTCSATGRAEAGFWPVISSRSTTT